MPKHLEYRDPYSKRSVLQALRWAKASAECHGIGVSDGDETFCIHGAELNFQQPRVVSEHIILRLASSRRHEAVGFQDLPTLIPI